MTGQGTKVNVSRNLDPVYGFTYSITNNGDGRGYTYNKTITENGVDKDVTYLVIFGDMIISTWERKVTTPIIETIQLADDSTKFIKTYPSGVFKSERVLCDDFTIVNFSGGTLTQDSDIYIELLDTSVTPAVSFEPKQYTTNLKPGNKTQYQFYLEHIGDPVIFDAVYKVITARI